MNAREIISEKLRNEKIQICIITLMGILMRLGYILYTPFMMGQHDLTVLGSGQGHLGLGFTPHAG